MHPRGGAAPWSSAQNKRVDAILAFVRSHGAVHPRQVDDHFAHGTVTNYWGGSSNATTHLLDAMQYRGLLRVVRREAGIRIYSVPTHVRPAAPAAERDARLDALVDIVVGKYAPLPQWRRALKPALERAKRRLAHTRVNGVDWYWPADEAIENAATEDEVRLLAPFDPVVWDRRRFELFWGWAYRFEAYTPVSRRQRGYYALPLLWRDRMVGWGNVSVKTGTMITDFGYIGGRAPRERRFKAALEQDIARLRAFLVTRSKSPRPRPG
jgi:uncharacterized protein YcaQ